MESESQALNERDLLIKMLSLLETKISPTVSRDNDDKFRVYDNKALMSLLNIKDKYLKKLRDNGYLGYSREGDKYWYTQEDVDNFLKRFHYNAFAGTGNLSL